MLWRLTHDTDIGYELTTLLLVNSETGLPIAPVEMYLKTAETIDTTGDVSVTDTPHWDQVLLLMKSAGLEMEHWQQQTGSAIIKRLLVASMALVFVWNLIRLTTPEATEFKDLPARLSGRTHKRKKPYTTGILLSGLFVLLRIIAFRVLREVRNRRTP
jgi:hypothetical protein